MRELRLLQPPRRRPRRRPGLFRARPPVPIARPAAAGAPARLWRGVCPRLVVAPRGGPRPTRQRTPPLAQERLRPPQAGQATDVDPLARPDDPRVLCRPSAVRLRPGDARARCSPALLGDEAGAGLPRAAVGSAVAGTGAGPARRAVLTRRWDAGALPGRGASRDQAMHGAARTDTVELTFSGARPDGA